MADDVCIVRSMTTDAVNHAPAQILMNTGSQQFGRPSLGAWTLYGLGCETENLPGYVVLSSANGTSGGASNWGCGFLPTAYAGVPFRSRAIRSCISPIPPAGTTETQRASLDSIRRLERNALAEVRDPEIEARIQSYEMAFRLQSTAPELMNLAEESRKRSTRTASIRRRPRSREIACWPGDSSSAACASCNLFHEAWDQHGGLKAGLTANCSDTDRVRPRWCRISSSADCSTTRW